MKLWQYIYFRRQASDRNTVQLGPLNFHTVGTVVLARPILFNTCLDPLSHLPCVVYDALTEKRTLNIFCNCF